MNTNIYRNLLKGVSPTTLLVEAATAKDTDFSQYVSDVSWNDITRIGVITVRHVRANGVEAVLFVGFLLDAYKQLTAKEKQLFDNVLEDCDVGRTQAYRSIGVWRKLGHRLATEPKLMRNFVPEALKMLCEAKVPDAARDEGIALAAAGKFVNIKAATEICARHVTAATPEQDLPAVKPRQETIEKVSRAVAVEKPANGALQKKPLTKPLGLIGAAVRLVVEFKGKQVDGNVSKPVLAKVITATKRFLSDLEKRYAAMESKQLQEVTE